MLPRKFLKKVALVASLSSIAAIFSARWTTSTTSFSRPAVKHARASREVQMKILRVVNSSSLMKDIDQQRPPFTFILDPREKFEAKITETSGFRWSAVNMVKSAIANRERRDAIRATWGGVSQLNNVQISTVFILGKPDDQETQKEVEKEFRIFEDVLQIDIPDDYSHVPEKTLAGMQWTGEVLPVNWLYSSGDDDIALHVSNFIRHIENQTLTQARDKLPLSEILESMPIICIYAYSPRDPPARNPKSKWFMPRDRYYPKLWPPYCRGGWYSIPVGTVARLYEVSRQMPLLHLDDVWITGLMRVKMLAMRGEVDEKYLLDALILPAPLSQRNDRELASNAGENDLSKVIVSHAWGNINGREVNVSQVLRDTWQKWRKSKFDPGRNQTSS